MDAAIGRLHVSITMARPLEQYTLEPVHPEPEESVARTHRRNTQLAASDADRARWSLLSRFPAGPRF